MSSPKENNGTQSPSITAVDVSIAAIGSAVPEIRASVRMDPSMAIFVLALAAMAVAALALYVIHGVTRGQKR